MNGFLRGHRVLAVKKELVPDGENSFWTFCVEYLDGGRVWAAKRSLRESSGPFVAQGAVMIKDPYPGQEGPFSPLQLLNVNGTLFFNAVDPSHGYEFWKSDGTESGTVLVKDIHPGVGDPLLSGHPFLYANGALFFPADDGVHGVQLWKYVPDPVSKIARAGNQVAFSWPVDGSGYTLEQKGDLSSSLNWSKIPGTPTIVGNQYTFTNTVTSRSQFFRLTK